MKTETIYIYLSDEGTDVWRPVEADNLGNKRYRIISSNNDPEDEKWEFRIGDIVRCESKVLNNSVPIVCLVAIAKE